MGVGCLLVLASALLGGCGCGGDSPAPRPRSEDLVSISAPRDGSSTAERSVDATGTVRAASSGYQTVGVTVNGRRIEPQYGPDRFRSRAALELGDNAIPAEARFFGIGGQALGVTRSRVVRVTRTAGEGRGDLDLATAFLAAPPRARGLC